MRPGTKRRVTQFLGALSVGIVIAAAVGAASGSDFRDAPLLGAVLSGLSAVIHAVVVTAVIGGVEIFVPPTRFGHTFERAPFLVTFGIKALVYGAVIVMVFGGRLGQRLVAAVLLSPDGAEVAWLTRSSTAPVMARAVAFVLVFIMLVHLGRLIGERTLRNVLVGRYRRARIEERFFLFIDIVGSTPLAERLGPDTVYRFLGEVFRLASAPVDDHEGEVYQYVGDEIVITWTVAEGRGRARPLACFFAIRQALEAASPEFQRDFGARPRLRAALHAGSVIAGEVGGTRRAIVFHGDVMNTTSRIEQATRDLERPFLVSEDALSRLEGSDSYALEDLGPQQLRGRASAVRLYAVTTKP